MNRWKRLLTLLLALLLLPLPTFAARTSADNALSLRGAWVSTAYHLDYPSSPTADPQTLMTDAAAILDDFQAAGINAVFLQVREYLILVARKWRIAIRTAPSQGATPTLNVPRRNIA